MENYAESYACKEAYYFFHACAHAYNNLFNSVKPLRLYQLHEVYWLVRAKTVVVKSCRLCLLSCLPMCFSMFFCV
jgi:hypothetical protein